MTQLHPRIYLEVTLELGASGVGELIANTLAVRHVTVVVLDVKPIVTENCEFPSRLAVVLLTL